MAEVINEIVWDEPIVLHPGMDYKDGTTYFTVPLRRTVLVPSKKKDVAPTQKTEQQTYAVSSERSGIWYDKEALEAHGFVTVPMLYVETESRWTLKSVKDFLDGKASGPKSADLLSEIRTIYTKYVEFADEAYYDIMALFILYTYVFRIFESTGYLHFNGTAASGKSRNLALLNAFAFNNVLASSMSAASLYRKLAGSPGTTCIDESEGFEGERGEELRRILNSGYKLGAKVYRTEKNENDVYKPVEYEVFGPKALASINQLDNVIGSRCLIVAMRPAIRELPDFIGSDPAWSETRDRLYLWAMENTAALAAMRDQWRDIAPTAKKARLASRLIGRQWETAGQLIILADYIGGEKFATQIIDFMNGYFAKQQEAVDATDRIRTSLRCLPRVLATMSYTDDHLYSAADIREVIAEYMDADSTEFFKTKHSTKNLNVLGFKHTVRQNGGLRIQLLEEAVRNEIKQRRVEPFPEDEAWLRGEVSYQQAQTLNLAPTRTEGPPNWWDKETDDDPSTA